MKKTLLIILLLTIRSYSQDLIGTWKPVSYEDEISYYNKAIDSISFKDPSRKREAESFKQMSDLIVFSQSYSFKNDGTYVLKLPAVGETENGTFKINEINKTIVMVTDEDITDELSYIYTNGILFLEMKLEVGFIKLGLAKVSN